MNNIFYMAKYTDKFPKAKEVHDYTRYLIHRERRRHPWTTSNLFLASPHLRLPRR
jgi:hypothetical protein